MVLTNEIDKVRSQLNECLDYQYIKVTLENTIKEKEILRGKVAELE